MRRGGKPVEHEPYPAQIQRVQAMPYGLRGFRTFCRILGLRIEPFQVFLLALYFAGIQELVILIPKKNGKTTLLAALALYHLLMVAKAECIIVASSRDQAMILLNQAVKLIEDAGLERRALPGDRHEPTRYAGVYEIHDGYRLIRFEQGRIRVLAADADTADGIIPTLALVDELHRHRSRELYGVLRDGLVGTAQMITISTAGASMDSPLGHLLTKAREFAVEQTKRRRTYTSPDGSFVLVEWALDPEDDPHDMRKVKAVNPASWHRVQTLRQRHDSPSTSPGQWLRFACGVWTEGEEPAIAADEWDRGRTDGPWALSPDEPVSLAPSIGGNAVVAAAAMREDGRVAVREWHLQAEAGTSIQARTEALIVELCDDLNIVQIAHPLGGHIRSLELLKARGLPLVEAHPSPARLVAASGTFDRLLREGKLIHDGDPKTRAQVLSAIRKSTETGERYLPADRSRAIGALVMAVHAATAVPAEPPMVGIL